MEKLGIRFLSLTNTPVENVEEQILDQNPRVLLTNVESLNNSAVQRKISKLKLSYIAIDEAQVNFQFDTFIVNLSLYDYTLQNANMLLLRHLHKS